MRHDSDDEGGMATSNTFGNIDVFNLKLSRSHLIGKEWNYFFVANNIMGDWKVAVLLSIVGTKIFSLLHDLLSLENTSNKMVKELLDVLTKHLQLE